MNKDLIIKRSTYDFIFFITYIVGLFLANTIFSYSIVLFAYAGFLLKIFFIDKNIKFDKFYIIIIFLFLSNILLQMALNISFRTLNYSIIIILGLVIYPSLANFKLNKIDISRTAFFLSIVFLLHPNVFNREVPFCSYFINPNSLAGIYLFLFFLIELTASKKIRLVNRFLIMPIYIYLIQSRGLLLALIVYFLMIFTTKYKLRWIVITGIIFFMIVMFVFYINPNDNFLIHILSFVGIENLSIFGSNLTYGAHRELLWRAAMDNPNPFFGIGFGGANDFIFAKTGHNLSAHNTFLNMYLEGGYAFLFTYIISTILFYLKSKSYVTKAFIVALNVRMFFEAGFPFGLSIQSAILFLPYFIDKIFSHEKNNIPFTDSIIK